MKSDQDEDFIKHTHAFEQSVLALQKDLEYMADHTKVSDRFLDRKNKIVGHIISYHNYMESFVMELEKENDFLKKVITSLKAICVIHGVVDFPRFLQWGKTLLVSRANELQQEDKFRLPFMFDKKLRCFSKEEQVVIESLLFRQSNLQLNAVLQKIKERKNSFAHGNTTQRGQTKEEQKKKRDGYNSLTP